jgi:hypothetical protein
VGNELSQSGINTRELDSKRRMKTTPPRLAAIEIIHAKSYDPNLSNISQNFPFGVPPSLQ